MINVQISPVHTLETFFSHHPDFKILFGNPERNYQVLHQGKVIQELTFFEKDYINPSYITPVDGISLILLVEIQIKCVSGKLAILSKQMDVYRNSQTAKKLSTEYTILTKVLDQLHDTLILLRSRESIYEQHHEK